MHKNELEFLLGKMEKLIQQGKQLQERYSVAKKAVHPYLQASAQNLIYYLALRNNDLRKIQEKLASLGLSSLGRSEAHALPNLQLLRFHLKRMLGLNNPQNGPELVKEFHKLNTLLPAHSTTLLGNLPPNQSRHIMVTLAAEMVNDTSQIKNLLEAGMTCVRINCAHDNEETWLSLIQTVRQASKDTGLGCKIFMDLAGPKIRTGALRAEPGLVEIKPVFHPDGQLSAAARVWLVPPETEAPDPAEAVLILPAPWLNGLEHHHKIQFKDQKGRKRIFRVEAIINNCVRVRLKKNAIIGSDLEFSYQCSAGTEKKTAPVGPLPEIQVPLLLFKKDLLVLHGRDEAGEPAKRDVTGKVIAPAHIACTLPSVLKNVKKGHRVLLNDGKIEGQVVRTHADEITLQITYAKDKGSKLRSGKGINFPDTSLQVKGLTPKDRTDLLFVIKHADVVNMSFVNTPADVKDLFKVLRNLKGDKIGVLLKIETKRAFNNLPQLLLTVMQRYPVGIMIARGDMAVEVGWNRLAEVQEEILWLCEAAHLPVVWATQVLDTLAQKGLPSRSEITDAAMSQRAECVMLNKGPYIIEAVKTLKDILQRMQGHQFKKTSMLRQLRVARLNQSPSKKTE